MSKATRPGSEAVTAKGWLQANKWLLARRVSQFFFLALFLAGPLAGIWIVKGTLASSMTLDVLPLTDPYIQLQSLLAGHLPARQALIGALIVLVAYAAIGGRVYCSWVCPINPVTDLAAWMHRRLGLAKGWQPPRASRYWLLAATLLVSVLTGTIAWEAVNPVTMVHRGLVFGAAFAWAVIAVVFLFDLLLSHRGWCGHLCPVGAFYGLVGSSALVRVAAPARARCNDCMDCYAVCPEPQVITPALKGAAAGHGPMIGARECTNCGRCVDVCSLDVFRFQARWQDEATRRPAAAHRQSNLPPNHQLTTHANGE